MNTISDVLAAAAPRPRDSAASKEERHQLSNDKRTYATRFANKMAICLANGLRETFPGVLPDETGGGIESPVQSVRGPKKLDVNYSTPQMGLGFGISLKSVHFKEKAARGYIHNMKRNDEELRVEASGYHQRQPYAVMIAVMFLPYEACDDGNKRYPSSFGEWVRYLRPLATRRDAQDDIAKYERVFVALYDPEGSAMEFFDVESAPPKTGRPKKLLSYREFLDQIELTYAQRNSADFYWDESSSSETDEPPPEGA